MRGNRRGFTLVEALAATLLMVVVLPVVIEAMSGASRLAVDAQRRSVAAELADRRLTEVLLDGSWETGSQRGTFEADDVGDEAARIYSWEITLDDWQEPSLELLTMRVLWDRRGAEQAVELTTVVYTGTAQ